MIKLCEMTSKRPTFVIADFSLFCKLLLVIRYATRNKYFASTLISLFYG